MFTFPLYPLIFSLYPVIALLGQNIQQVNPYVALVPGLLCLISTAIIFGLLRLIFKDWGKAAQVTFLFILFFYAYGHFYSLIEDKSIAGIIIGRHRFVAPAWGLIWIALTVWMIKRPAFSASLTKWLNTVSILMLLFPIGQITYTQIRTNQLQAEVKSAQENLAPVSAPQANTPDVYYIILDGYTRSDTLKSHYQVDNSKFIAQLKDLGFTLPSCAQSNYAWTPVSLSSSLNMNYIEDISKAFGITNIDNIDAVSHGKFINQSLVRKEFARLGYKFVSFATDYPFLNIEDADVYITQRKNPLDPFKSGFEVTFFEQLFLRTTAIRLVTESVDASYIKLPTKVKTPEEVRYEYILWFLDQLEVIPDLPGPKFVYAHLVAPHEPFVLSKDGEFEFNPSTRPGYGNQVQYLNKRVIPILKTIIAKSKVPPIIIVQGDHGRERVDRMEILNAYYLPGGGNQKVYPTITPVNSFRLIFDNYFGGDYPFLPDISYQSAEEYVYTFTVVPQTCEPEP